MSTDTIRKYELQAKETSPIQLPVGSKMLTVITQHGRTMLYARVNSSETMLETRVLYVRRTGDPLTGDEGPYLSTFLLQDGALVFHVFSDGL